MNEKQSEKIPKSVAEMSDEATCKSVLEEKPQGNSKSTFDTEDVKKTEEHEEIIKSCIISNLDIDSKQKEELQLEKEKQPHNKDNTEIVNVHSIINEIDDTSIPLVDTFGDRMIKSMFESKEDSFSTNLESKKIEDNLKGGAFQELKEKEDLFSIGNEICNKTLVDRDDVKDMNKNENSINLYHDKVKEFESEENQSSDNTACEPGAELYSTENIMDVSETNTVKETGPNNDEIDKYNDGINELKVKNSTNIELSIENKVTLNEKVSNDMVDKENIVVNISVPKDNLDDIESMDTHTDETIDSNVISNEELFKSVQKDFPCNKKSEYEGVNNLENVINKEQSQLKEIEDAESNTSKDAIEKKDEEQIALLNIDKQSNDLSDSCLKKYNIVDNISVPKDNLDYIESMDTHTDKAIDSNAKSNKELLKSDQKDCPCKKESKCKRVDNLESVINKELSQLEETEHAESNTCKAAIEKTDEEQIPLLNIDEQSNDLSDSCLKQNEQDFESSIGKNSHNSREASIEKGITDIPESSNNFKAIRKDLEQVTFESDTQDSNNEDDKMKLIWDDNDELEDTSKTCLGDLKNNSSNNQYLPLTEHGLNKPDMMLEIPTQGFIEFSDDDDPELTAKFEMSPDVEAGDLDVSNQSDDVGEKVNNVCQQNVEVDSKSEIQTMNKIDISEELSHEKDKENGNANEEINKNTLEEKSGESVNVDKNQLLEGIQDSSDSKELTIANNKTEIRKTEKDPEIDIAVTSIVESSCTEKRPVEICFKTVPEITIVQKKSHENASYDLVEPQPSTSTHNNQYSTLENIPQDSDVVEMSDSLGLLAESSRVMEDDEEQEDDEEVDEDDDFDVDDDNSNQMTVDHSEDSNAHVKDDTPCASDKEASGDSMNFAISTIVADKDMNNQEETAETVIEEAHKEVEIEEEMITTDPIVEEEDNEDLVEIAMDIETVKLSDTSDTEQEVEKEETDASTLPDKNGEVQEALDVIEEGIDDAPTMESNRVVLTFVDLEGSSSDDDIQEVEKKDASSETVTTVKMPADIDVISSSAGTSSDIVMKETETVISGLPKPPRLKPARLNISEVSIKTANNNVKDLPMVMPETEVKSPQDEEIFNLDSDDEGSVPEEKEEVSVEQDRPRDIAVKCVNKACRGEPPLRYAVADARAVAYYEGDKKRRAYVCDKCYESVVQWNQEVIAGIRNFKPLLDLDMGKYHEELVEISDSDSEDEAQPADPDDLIGDSTAKFLEENLTDLLNEVWTKYKMDDRLNETKATVQEELRRLQKECQEIDESFRVCQDATDRLRNELYSTFEHDTRQEPELTIYDTGEVSYITSEDENSFPQTRKSKRRSSLATEPSAKRPAIPLGYEPLHSHVNTDDQKMATLDKLDDDNTDISVVKLSVEAAPPDLPPPGPVTRVPLKPGMQVYARKKASWLEAVIMEVSPKFPSDLFTTCRVKFEHRALKDPYELIPGRCLAYHSPAEVRLIIGTRVIALFKITGAKASFSAGIVAEIPNPVNNYRYLIFFDDGYAQYVPHALLRLVCESSALVWEEVHADSRQFVKDYITSYPERPMVRLHAGQNLKTEYRGKWWTSVVERVDASLVQVLFHENGRREWIYRGSTRLAPLFLELQAAERQRPRALPRAQPTAKSNLPYVEYTRSSEQTPKPAEPRVHNTEQEMRHQRSVAKKSTAVSQPQPATSNNLDNVTSRVVFYTPKNAVKPHKIVPHACSPRCRRTDVLQLKDLRTYNPLAKPLLSGWERQVVRWKGHKQVMYVGPCGRRLRDVRELHRYLRATASDMPVDLFDFSPLTHCLAEFVLNKCIVAKKDLSHGKENVPVPCVNYYDDRLPEFCSYNTERTPTAGVPLNLDPEFLCGCDCEDDCEDKSKCACWQLTLEGARTIRMGDDVGYVYKRLPKPLPSGIYECNSRCKCKHTCLNRVAQHPLQLKLQVFKTLNRGWGIRALNDVPEGSFLCVYAGNLLTDATANLDGLNEGDEYLAELDYIEVVEQMKEGYEDDIPNNIKKLDKKELNESESEEEESPSSSSDEEGESKGEADDDFQPGYLGSGITHFTKRLRKRDKNNDTDKGTDNTKEKGKENTKDKGKENTKDKEEKSKNGDEDCITISDDESREPSCFTAAAGMGGSEFVSKYRSVRSLFGEDEACYIMDAKVQGNIGRYLNHSCSPNVFVQNVFVDTHDPRFPWVAFFALNHIRAGTELTWNYNYDVGSVPGKVLYCYCGAPNCRGRLL